MQTHIYKTRYIQKLTATTAYIPLTYNSIAMNASTQSRNPSWDRLPTLFRIGSILLQNCDDLGYSLWYILNILSTRKKSRCRDFHFLIFRFTAVCVICLRGCNVFDGDKVDPLSLMAAPIFYCICNSTSIIKHCHSSFLKLESVHSKY